MRPILFAVTAASAAGLVLATPGTAFAFNPQPDPPRTAVDISINVTASQFHVGVTVVEATTGPAVTIYPPGPTASPPSTAS